jgi:hypothetical protein
MPFTALQEKLLKNCPTDIHIRKTGFSITKKKIFSSVCVVKPIEANLNEHSEQARAPHTNGPRDVPRCGALSSSSKDAALQGGMIVVLRPLFAAALVVCRRYFIVAPSPFPAAQLVVHRR